jgi:hypothetical protein
VQGITLAIAVIASVTVFLLNPVYGLIVYVVSFIYYPTYLSVPIGTVDFTVRRIVVLAVFAKIFLLTDLPSRFKFIWLDKLIIIYFVAQLIAGATTSVTLTAFLENRGGAVFDMVLPYFATRMIIKSRDQYLTLLKCILVISVPLAIVALYECLTGYNPFAFLQEYSAWSIWADIILAPRYGFHRAKTMFEHPIMLGMFFSMFGPICVGLFRSIKEHRLLYSISTIFMAIGVFSSMSTGPLLAAFLAIPFIAFWRWRKYWKEVAIVIITMCIYVEFISNRHFFDVFGDFFVFSRGTAWYRSKLIDVALLEGGMSGHWLTGFSFGTDPGWSSKIDGRNHTDMVNHYLVILYSYGLVGFLPFLAVIGAAIKRIINSFKICDTESDRWLIWCLSAALFGILGAMNSTMLFGPPITIFYMILALCGAMPAIVTTRGYIQRMVSGITLPNNSRSIPMMANNGWIHPLYKHRHNT